MTCRAPRAHNAQAVTAVQGHSDLSKVDAIAAEVRALDKQLRAADKEAGQYNSRCEGSW